MQDEPMKTLSVVQKQGNVWESLAGNISRFSFSEILMLKDKPVKCRSVCGITILTKNGVIGLIGMKSYFGQI